MLLKDFFENETKTLANTYYAVALYRLVLCPTILLALAVPNPLLVKTLHMALEVVKLLWA